MPLTLRACKHRINNQHRIEVIVKQFGRLKGKLDIGCRSFVRDSHPTLASGFRFSDLGSPRIWSACNHSKMLFNQTQCHLGLEIANQNQNGVVRDEVLLRVPRHILAVDQLEVGQPAERGPTIWMSLERGSSDFVVQEAPRKSSRA